MSTTWARENRQTICLLHTQNYIHVQKPLYKQNSTHARQIGYTATMAYIITWLQIAYNTYRTMTYIARKNNDLNRNNNVKVIEKCTNFYFGTEKLRPKF